MPVKTKGRPKIMRRCTYCPRVFGARQLRTHQTHCPSRPIEMDGRSMSPKQWAAELGIGHNTILRRRALGLPVVDVLSKGRVTL